MLTNPCLHRLALRIFRNEGKGIARRTESDRPGNVSVIEHGGLLRFFLKLLDGVRIDAGDQDDSEGYRRAGSLIRRFVSNRRPVPANFNRRAVIGADKPVVFEIQIWFHKCLPWRWRLG